MHYGVWLLIFLRKEQMQMKLVLAEKPSVAQSIAKVLGAAKREDGYLEGKAHEFRSRIQRAAESEIIQVFVLNHIFDLLIINQKIGSKQIGLVFCIIRHIVECIILHTWVGFIFMVIVLVVVMQIFEKVKEQLLKWTID